MKLRTKIFSVFGLALALNLVFIWFGLSYVLDLVSNRLMENQAKTLTLFIQHQIIAGFAEYPDSPMGPRIDRYLEEAKHVSDESREFAIVKILLITPSLHVENAWPGSEAGQDYSSHEDIRQTMENHRMIVATETFPGPAGQRTDIDVVAWFQLPPGPDGLPRPRVLEVKLDFAQSRVLLEAQYQVIELAAFILAAALLAGLLASLMWMISRTAVRPVLRVSRALETVASGDLDIQLPERGDDEFALLARRFNQMTVGLRERLHLTRYVSRGTVQAVRQAVSAGDGPEPGNGRRVELAVFFSDIRGFTSYSENRDPAEVITTLNAILSLQAELIPRYGGDIDKFVGDEVMAVFDSPLAAVQAAVAIQRQLELQRATVSGLHIGIGIHFGTVVQGDVGSASQRDFTVIGDTVNTAARLQAVSLGGQILVSEAAVRQMGSRHGLPVVSHGTLTLKGKDIRLKSFRIIWNGPEPEAL